MRFSIYTISTAYIRLIHATDSFARFNRFRNIRAPHGYVGQQGPPPVVKEQFGCTLRGMMLVLMGRFPLLQQQISLSARKSLKQYPWAHAFSNVQP